MTAWGMLKGCSSFWVVIFGADIFVH